MKALETLHKRGIVYFDFEEVTPISKKLPVSINDMRIIKDKNGNEMAFVEMEDPKGSVQSVPVFSSYWKVIGPKILSAKGKIILVNVFRDNNDKFLFGQKGFVSEQSKILRMVKEMP